MSNVVLTSSSMASSSHGSIKTAKLCKSNKGQSAFIIACMFAFDDVEKSQGMFRYSFLKLINRLFKILNIWLNISEEVAEEVNETASI